MHKTREKIQMCPPTGCLGTGGDKDCGEPRPPGAGLQALHSSPLLWDPVHGGLGQKVEEVRAGEKGPNLFLHL